MEELAKQLKSIYLNTSDRSMYDRSNSYMAMAKHVQSLILAARIEEIGRIFPDLNSQSGITIKTGSVKDFAFKRKIQLEKDLAAVVKE
jgi:hypothetical protein